MWTMIWAMKQQIHCILSSQLDRSNKASWRGLPLTYEALLMSLCWLLLSFQGHRNQFYTNMDHFTPPTICNQNNSVVQCSLLSVSAACKQGSSIDPLWLLLHPRNAIKPINVHSSVRGVGLTCACVSC